jgi:phosphocarrier protein HPr
MREIKLTYTGEIGLHARPASIIVKEMAGFKSNVTVCKGTKETNIKSLLGIMGLGICQNDRIVIRIEGEDEDTVAEALIRLGKTNDLW